MNVHKLIEFKLDEFRFALRTGSVIQFILSNISKNNRQQFYQMYHRRGLNGAIAAGINVPPDFPIGSLDEVFFERIYNVEGFIPKESDVVVDIGAHTGDWTVYCAKALKVKDIHAFEPLNENIFWANKIIQANGCKNVKLYDIALSDKDGEADMFYEGTMLSKEQYSNNEGKQRIKFSTLDSFDLKCNILKIDVEGFELNVLEGSIQTIRKNKPKIIIETHTKVLQKQCHSFLSNEGYKLLVKGRKVNARRKYKSKNFDIVTNLFYSQV